MNLLPCTKINFAADLQKLLAIQNVTFKPKSNLNKMIVIADGDIASNDLDAKAFHWH